jgi:hypothetical protein
MNRMKKVILSVALIAAMGLAAQSQTQTQKQEVQKSHEKKRQLNPSEQSKKEAERAMKNLNLDASQTAKWEQAALLRIQSNAPIKEKLSGSTTPDERKQLHQQIRAQHEQFDKEVTGFLSDEQKSKFNELKQKRHHKRKEHRMIEKSNQ